MDKSFNEEMKSLFEGLELPSDEEIKDDTWRLRLRLAFLGKKRDPSIGKKTGAKLKGRKPSIETLQKIAKKVIGSKRRPPSKETKEKISNALKGKPGGNAGKKFSDEHRKNLSESHKGNTPSNKGSTWSEEFRQKRMNNPKNYPTCPICQRRMYITHFVRWGHGPNCTKG
jgi:hypothetical protein